MFFIGFIDGCVLPVEIEDALIIKRLGFVVLGGWILRSMHFVQFGNNRSYAKFLIIELKLCRFVNRFLLQT